MTRIRLIAPIAVLAAAALVLTGCAPATNPAVGGTGTADTSTPGGAHHTAKPIKKPVVHTVSQPKSQYAFGCNDLAPAAQITPVFSHTMAEADPASDDRVEGDGQLSELYYVEDLGGVTCRWDDAASTSGSGDETLDITVMPATAAGWARFLASPIGPGVAGHTFTSCNGTQGGGENGCEFDDYINGTWLYANFQDMVPSPAATGATLPPPIQTLLKADVTKITSGPFAMAATPAVGAVAMANDGTKLITSSQLKTAFATAAPLSVNCMPDDAGPWGTYVESLYSVTGAQGCNLEDNQGNQYAELSWMVGGEWAANQAEAATPTETPLAVPGLPAGDSAVTYADPNGSIRMDLILGGNWLSVWMLNTQNPGGGEPPLTVTPLAALSSLAADLETTVRS
ncbi:MAG TPA: hypothetical protein VHZ98_10420 [Galbitalea sp.]|jgi:hypothetical protein|nr:hypothetical protein [Galbitalea sp.]